MTPTGGRWEAEQGILWGGGGGGGEGDSSPTWAGKADLTGDQTLRVSFWPASQGHLIPAPFPLGSWRN